MDLLFCAHNRQNTYALGLQIWASGFWLHDMIRKPTTTVDQRLSVEEFTSILLRVVVERRLRAYNQKL